MKPIASAMLAPSGARHGAAHRGGGVGAQQAEDQLLDASGATIRRSSGSSIARSSRTTASRMRASSVATNAGGNIGGRNPRRRSPHRRRAPAASSQPNRRGCQASRQVWSLRARFEQLAGERDLTGDQKITSRAVFERPATDIDQSSALRDHREHRAMAQRLVKRGGAGDAVVGEAGVGGFLSAIDGDARREQRDQLAIDGRARARRRSRPIRRVHAATRRIPSAKLTRRWATRTGRGARRTLLPADAPPSAWA